MFVAATSTTPPTTHTLSWKLGLQIKWQGQFHYFKNDEVQEEEWWGAGRNKIHFKISRGDKDDGVVASMPKFWQVELVFSTCHYPSYLICQIV